MNIEEYIEKLFEGGKIRRFGNGEYINFSVVIDKKLLRDNIDLLAKEMHMAVEMQSVNKKKPKYDRVFIEDVKSLIK